VFRAGSTPVIVDYGHNAAALEVTGRFVRDVWQGQPVAAVTLPGDRRDDLLIASAQAIARSFPAVVIYEDSDKRGRKSGEMLALIGSALREARPDISCHPAENPAEALRVALELATDGPVLFVYEKLPLAMDALAAVGALPWPEERRTATSQTTIMGTRPSRSAEPPEAEVATASTPEPSAPASAADAAVASATAVVAGAAEAAEAVVADAAAVVANAAAAAITDAADAALMRPSSTRPPAQASMHEQRTAPSIGRPAQPSGSPATQTLRPAQRAPMTAVPAQPAQPKPTGAPQPESPTAADVLQQKPVRVTNGERQESSTDGSADYCL
jgi:hypothetical protein